MESINTSVSFKGTQPGAIVREISRIAAFDRGQFHKLAAQTQVTRIRRRTRTGIDVNGATFKPLASSTQRSAFPRPKPGQKKLSGQVRGPNHILEAQGGMLAAMTSEGDQDRGRIYFNNPQAERIASYQNDGTKPYTIRPKGGKALRIPVLFGGAFLATKRGSRRLAGVKLEFTESTGAFSRAVNHPGLSKREFFGFSESDADEILRIAARMHDANVALEASSEVTVLG